MIVNSVLVLLVIVLVAFTRSKVIFTVVQSHRLKSQNIDSIDTVISGYIYIYIYMCIYIHIYVVYISIESLSIDIR